MNDQIIRLFEILKILNRFPRELTITQIRNKLSDIQIDVTVRTLQRDMNALSAIFIGIDSCRHEDRSVGWFWAENAPVLNLSGLSMNQALSFSLIKKFLTPLFPSVTLNELAPFFEQAETTLLAINENPLLEWPNKIAVVQPTQPLLPLNVNPDIQKVVSAALLKDMQLDVTYMHSSGKENNYLLNPLGLVLRSGVSYLVASKNDKGDVGIFALQRIKKHELTESEVIRPEGFDLQTYINEGHMGFNLTGAKPFEPIQIKVIFDAISVKHLYETRLSEDQVTEELGDGNFKVTATVQETEQLFWWLLSFGFRVEVLEPPELRQKMVDSVQVLAKRYAI